MSNRQCYYPNGDLTKENDIPCGDGDNVPCCPSGWTCQSNGLCYLPNENYYGRYTCTDKTWQSEGCPQICTQDKTAIGNEALLDCCTNQWCCDTNRPNPGCCDTTTTRFSLDSRKIQIPLGGSSSSSPGSSSKQSNSPTTAAPSTIQTVQPSLITSISSNSAQGLVTVVVTSQITALITTSPSTETSPSSSSNHSGPSAKILAPAIIVPIVALLLLASVIFLLLRRHKKHKSRIYGTTGGGPTGLNAVPMYKSSQEKVSPFSGYSGSELEGDSPTRSTHRYNAPSDIRASALASPDPAAGATGLGAGKLAAHSPLRESFVSELPSTPSQTGDVSNNHKRGSGISSVGGGAAGLGIVKDGDGHQPVEKQETPLAELSATKSVQRKSRLGLPPLQGQVQEQG